MTYNANSGNTPTHSPTGFPKCWGITRWTFTRKKAGFLGYFQEYLIKMGFKKLIDIGNTLI